MPKDLLEEAPQVRGFVFELAEAEGRLTLFARHHPAFGGVSVDWDTSDLRRRVAAGRKQLLARAVGLQRKAGSLVLDATGGLGRDAFTLASLGAEVSLAERQPLMLGLLEDGLRRARENPSTALAAGRMEILRGDARQHLASRRWDAIYLDPMYPGHDRDAKSKKELQFLRELSGGDADAAELLEAALRAMPPRVIVKRPGSAPRLGSRAPAFELRGTRARFDVYVAAAEKN